VNIHTKLVEAMVKVLEIYFQENGYEYEELATYDQSCFTKEQFEEMIELVNTHLS